MKVNITGQPAASGGTTPTGTGFTHITAGVQDGAAKLVDTADINNTQVTLAKMADVATSTVFYRKTGGTGVPEVQTLATIKTDLGLTGTNSGDQTITLTGEATGSGTGSFVVTLLNSAVVGKVLTGLSLVTSQVITATDTILLAFGYIQAQITALTTTVGTKADKTITISATAPLSGGGDLSSNRTITTSIATNKLIGRATAGTGVMEEITLGTNLSFSGTTLNATGGSFTVTETEVDFGMVPTTDKTFTVVDASITATKKIMVTESGSTATGRVASGDSLWDTISYSCIAGTGTFTLYARASGSVVGLRKLYYTYS